MKFTLPLVLFLFSALVCSSVADESDMNGTKDGGTPQQPLASGTQESRVPANLPAGVKAMMDLDYSGHGRTSQKLDLFIPTTTKPLPLIIWVHGGGWQHPGKSPCSALQFISRGYVVASINYRLTDEAIWPAQINDCKGAIRYLRAHAQDYHIDPDRVGVWGSSAGGHLVAMLGVSGGVKELEGDVGGNLQYSSRVQAVCDWFGPTDLSQFTAPHGPLTLVVSKLLGGPIEKNEALCRSASPITYVNSEAPPFLIMHGSIDAMVPVGQSESLRDALQKAGVEVSFSLTPNKGHGYGSLASPANFTMVGEFFDKHLKVTRSPEGKGG